jgi:hypothetical protein
MHFFCTLGEYVHIYIQKPYINKIHTSLPIHSMLYFGHTCIQNAPYLWGMHVSQALQTYAISWSLLNVITRSRMHIWHSGPLEIHVIHTLQIHAISYNAIQTSRISLYICSPSHTRKHRHTNTSSTFNHVQSTHTSQCYACSLFRFLFLCLQGYNPRTCFWCQELQLSGLTLVPPKRLQP